MGLQELIADPTKPECVDPEMSAEFTESHANLLTEMGATLRIIQKRKG